MLLDRSKRKQEIKIRNPCSCNACIKSHMIIDLITLQQANQICMTYRYH